MRSTTCLPSLEQHRAACSAQGGSLQRTGRQLAALSTTRRSALPPILTRCSRRTCKAARRTHSPRACTSTASPSSPRSHGRRASAWARLRVRACARVVARHTAAGHTAALHTLRSSPTRTRTRARARTLAPPSSTRGCAVCSSQRLCTRTSSRSAWATAAATTPTTTTWAATTCARSPRSSTCRLGSG